MKSIDLESTTVASTDGGPNRWVGMTIGTNNLIHLEQNLQVLTCGKTENVRKLFNVPRLRQGANANFDPMHHWHVRDRDRFARIVDEMHAEATKQ